MGAVIAVEEIREILRLVGADPDHDPGLTPWLGERVADVADDRLPRRGRKPVLGAPFLPRRFQTPRAAFSTRDQLWITHRAILPPKSGPAPEARLPGCARQAAACRRAPRRGARPPGPTPHSIGRVLPHPRPAAPDGAAPWTGRRSLATLLRNTCEQCTNLSLPVAPVPPQRTDRRQFPGFRPPCDGLGVAAKHRGDLRGRQQRLSLWCTCGHMCGLSSWTCPAILFLLPAWCSGRSPSGMSSYGRQGPYCHHQP